MTELTIVGYHTITADPGPFVEPLGIWTAPEVFEAHLDHFERNYDVVDLDTLLDGRRPRRPLLITFDDGFQSVLDLARRVLGPRGLPSVVFVNPGVTGWGGPSLDQAMAGYESAFGEAALGAFLGHGQPIPATLAISNLASRLGPAAREELRRRLMAEVGTRLGPTPALIAPADLPGLARYGVAVGNHTQTHVHCRSLDAASMQQELADSRTALEAMVGRPVRSFAVPYGESIDLPRPVLRALRQAGHEATFLVHSRSNLMRPARDVYYRVAMDRIAPDRLDWALRRAPRRRLLTYLLDKTGRRPHGV